MTEQEQALIQHARDAAERSTLTLGYDEETDGVYARLNDGPEWTENSFDSIGQFFLDWPSEGQTVLLKWIDR